MKAFIAAASSLALLLTLDTIATADALTPVRSDMKASAKTESTGLRCRRLQRTAQTVIATQGYEAGSLHSSRRTVHRPRKLVRSVVGFAERRKAVGRGCYRCIARQFRRHVPIAKQLACGFHDICAEGGALKRSLSVCVNAVCNGQASCCQQEWDAECVTTASETCGEPCIGCSHNECENGDPLDATCNTCVSQICSVDPFCCDTAWSDECIGKVETVCGQSCETTTVSTLPPPPTSTVPSTDTTVPSGGTTLPDGSTTPDGTVPEGSTLPGGGTGSTVPGTIPPTTLPGDTTLPPPIPTTTVQSPGSTVTEAPTDDCTNVINFEDAPAGTNLSTTETSQGQPVAIKGNNPKLGVGVNAALLYDSDCPGKCTGRDTDLGTPNQDFGGPGIGDGGKAGSPTQNDEALHNLLIVASYLTDVNPADGLVDDPNDQKNTTTSMELDFAAFAPVSVRGLKLVDVGDTESPAKIELFDEIGNLILAVQPPHAEGNGLAKVQLPANEGVWKAVVTLKGSGGIDDIHLSCPGSTTTLPPGTTTLPPATTTTVPPGTTTLPPATTTTVPPGTTTLPPATTTTVPPGTTTLPPPTTTTVPPGTTTLPPPTTTTVPPPTTTLPPPTTTTVPPQADCPDTVELTLLAQTRESCSTNADCEFGKCNTTLGKCQTQTELDTGYTGIAHDADITDGVITVANVSCPNNDGGATCGLCTITGLNPQPGNCRCQNDNQKICNQPFATVDNDSCGGAACTCYLGPPLALSAGNTPACVVNKFAEDVSGTTNIDTGESLVTAHLRSLVFLGILLNEPCPYCTGDVTPNDGVRNGKCVDGANNGDDCDTNAINNSFPAPGGDGHSIDCFPNSPNVSGAGLIINLNQTTGTASLPATVPCGPVVGGTPILSCPCGLCSNDVTRPCHENGDCAAPGVCQAKNQSEPAPNQCNNTCVDVGGGEGQCDASGPDDLGCDGISKSNGEFFISCTSNADCDPNNIGIAAGNCTQSKRRECFLPTITATGDPDPTNPIGVATFCIPATANTGINLTAGLPGPGRVQSQGHAVARCGASIYTPNVGCP
jgi:hypothetical protein